jgi:uncharacterized protein YejL (UPF0352 family)
MMNIILSLADMNSTSPLKLAELILSNTGKLSEHTTPTQHSLHVHHNMSTNLYFFPDKRC